MASLDELLSNTSTKRTRRKAQIDLANQDIWLLKSIDDYLVKDLSQRRKGVFYPSSLGSTCDRYLYNAYYGLIIDDPIDANTKRIFGNGDYLGLRYEKYFEEMGILLGTEISLKNDMPPISGRLDFLIQHPDREKVIIELKSINQRNFSALSMAKYEHIIQTQIYLNLYNVDQGIVLYECKNNQQIKAFTVEKDTQQWEDIANRCINIMNMTEQPTICTGHRYCPCNKE